MKGREMKQADLPLASRTVISHSLSGKQFGSVSQDPYNFSYSAASSFYFKKYSGEIILNIGKGSTKNGACHSIFKTGEY